jgi:hypothetical protein
MRRLRKPDRVRLRSLPLWLRVPCTHTIKPRILGATVKRLCGQPALVYLVSDEKQLDFEFGPPGVYLPLCPDHRDQTIAHGKEVKLCPGKVQFSYLKASFKNETLAVSSTSAGDPRDRRRA